MKNKRVIIIVLAILLVFSTPLVTLAVTENETPVEYQEVVPFNFHHRVFIARWATRDAVPPSVFVETVRYGRLYSGTLNREANTIAQDVWGRWGAMFSGTVRFTGIML